MAVWRTHLSTAVKAGITIVVCTLLLLPPAFVLLSPDKKLGKAQGMRVHADAKQKAARTCLQQSFHSGTSQERRVFSQFGEDGITEAIFRCIGSTNKTYVEFGVQNGSECGTRRLREEDNWSGLLMDGGFDIPSINLHKEYMTAANIASLFHKYNVSTTFDFLTVDLDFNTFWVAQAVLAGGWRPRALAIEYNSNFRTLDQAYAVVYDPQGVWPNPALGANCYYGASALALARMLHFYGYVPLIIDRTNVNMFFIHQSVVGFVSGQHSQDPQFNLEEVLKAVQRLSGCDVSQCTAFPWHEPCDNMTWVQVPRNASFGSSDWEQQLPRVKLHHDHVPDFSRNLSWWEKSKDSVPAFKTRTFVEVKDDVEV